METISRRETLRWCVRTGLPVLGIAACVPLGRRLWARHQLRSELEQAAEPLWASHSDAELQIAPSALHQRLLPAFDQMCLNSKAFVDHIVAPSFANALGRCQTEQMKHDMLLRAFHSKVATTHEIVSGLRDVVAEQGKRLDDDWRSCCQSVAQRWGEMLQVSDNLWSGEKLLSEANLHVRSTLDALVAEMRQHSGGQLSIELPTAAIGSAALMALRLRVIDARLAILVFLGKALAPVVSAILAWLNDPRPELQIAVSSRLATLGKSLAREFQASVHDRLVELHSWQRSALHAVAKSIAERRVPILGASHK